jgi:guanine deaminase
VAPYDGRPVDEDLRPGVLLPGFVDAHVHFPQTRIVGRASGPLLDWLDRATFPEEARFADPAHAERVAATFCSRLAAAGTTLAMVYSSVHPRTADLLFQTLDRVGLEAIAGPVLMDEHCPEALRLPASEALPALADLADRWHGHDDGRLEVAAIPRFALSCSRELMAGAGRLARDRGLWTSTHLSENPLECRVAVERFGTRDYLEVYEQAGLVHDRCVLAHCIHLSGSEWDRLAAAGAVVGHCPDSNDFLGSGGMPVPEVLDRAMKVAIGTDIAAGRSFRVPRILSSAYDNGLRQGVPLSEARLLWWGTRGGALALGRPSAGVLAPGFDANLCLFEPPDPADDAEAVLASLLFDHDAPRMRRTWVRGRLVHAEEGWPTKSA